MGTEWIDDLQLDRARERISREWSDSVPVFSVRSVAALGISRPEILALQRRGHVHKIRHGAYCLSEAWEAGERDSALHRRILAASAMVGMRQPIYACGPFAAELHDLPLPSWQPKIIDLVRDSGRDTRPAQSGVKLRNRLEGVRIVSRNLTGEEVTVVGGIPVVGIAAASMTSVVDMQDEYAVAVLDAALAAGIDMRQLLEVGERWMSTRGMSAAMRMVPMARSGAESPLESISRVRFVRQGLPQPVLQQEFHDGRGFIGRVDMWWPDWRVVGEADGLMKYDDPSVLRMEKVREDRLRALGLSVVRWTWDEIWKSPDDVVARILTARASDASRRWAG